MPVGSERHALSPEYCEAGIPYLALREAAMHGVRPCG